MGINVNGNVRNRNKKNVLSALPEEGQNQYGFFSKSEIESLREDIFRPDFEKLQLFTSMLRRNATLKNAIITHSKL